MISLIKVMSYPYVSLFPDLLRNSGFSATAWRIHFSSYMYTLRRVSTKD